MPLWFTLLQAVPKGAEALGDLFRSPAKAAFPAVLDALAPENIAGARLLALTRELYSTLKAQHPYITCFDHSPFLLLQAEAMGEDSAQLLRDQAERLHAQAWNRGAGTLPNLVLTASSSVYSMPLRQGYAQALQRSKRMNCACIHTCFQQA